jgi:hypothetical protein
MTTPLPHSRLRLSALRPLPPVSRRRVACAAARLAATVSTRPSRPDVVIAIAGVALTARVCTMQPVIRHKALPGSSARGVTGRRSRTATRTGRGRLSRLLLRWSLWRRGYAERIGPGSTTRRARQQQRHRYVAHQQPVSVQPPCSDSRPTQPLSLMSSLISVAPWPADSLYIHLPWFRPPACTARPIGYGIACQWFVPHTVQPQQHPCSSCEPVSAPFRGNSSSGFSFTSWCTPCRAQPHSCSVSHRHPTTDSSFTPVPPLPWPDVHYACKQHSSPRYFLQPAQ